MRELPAGAGVAPAGPVARRLRPSETNRQAGLNRLLPNCPKAVETDFPDRDHTLCIMRHGLTAWTKGFLDAMDGWIGGCDG